MSSEYVYPGGRFDHLAEDELLSELMSQFKTRTGFRNGPSSGIIINTDADWTSEVEEFRTERFMSYLSVINSRGNFPRLQDCFKQAPKPRRNSYMKLWIIERDYREYFGSPFPAEELGYKDVRDFVVSHPHHWSIQKGWRGTGDVIKLSEEVDPAFGYQAGLIISYRFFGEGFLDVPDRDPVIAKVLNLDVLTSLQLKIDMKEKELGRLWDQMIEQNEQREAARIARQPISTSCSWTVLDWPASPPPPPPPEEREINEEEETRNLSEGEEDMVWVTAPKPWEVDPTIQVVWHTSNTPMPRWTGGEPKSPLGNAWKFDSEANASWRP